MFVSIDGSSLARIMQDIYLRDCSEMIVARSASRGREFVLQKQFFDWENANAQFPCIPSYFGRGACSVCRCARNRVVAPGPGFHIQDWT